MSDRHAEKDSLAPTGPGIETSFAQHVALAGPGVEATFLELVIVLVVGVVSRHAFVLVDGKELAG